MIRPKNKIGVFGNMLQNGWVGWDAFWLFVCFWKGKVKCQEQCYEHIQPMKWLFCAMKMSYLPVNINDIFDQFRKESGKIIES